jgi:drug/metabolite transporter (DMT)-like permease
MIKLATAIPIASAFLAAIASVLARLLLKGIPTQRILAANFFIMSATLLVLSPLFYIFAFTWENAGLVVLIALIDTTANYFYFKTFEHTEASVAVPILSLAPIVTFFASALFLGQRVSVFTIVCALIIIALIIGISTDWERIHAFKTATLYPALVSSFLFGISAIPSAYLLTTLHATNAPTLYMIRAALIGLFAIMVFKDSFVALDLKTYRFIFFRGLFVIGQWILLYYALTFGSAGVAVTLGNITPVFVLLMSISFLDESFSTKKFLAALAVLCVSLVI